MNPKLAPAYQMLNKIPGSDNGRRRREHLLRILYHERYLNRQGITWRMEHALGIDYSWWDLSWTVFVLDLWFVRRAFLVADYQLDYSWVRARKGYYLRGEGELSQEMVRAIQRAVAKADPCQLEIARRLTPAQRGQQGVSLTNLDHSAMRFRNNVRMR